MLALLPFANVAHADTVFVWNTNGTIVKLASNGVGIVFPTNLPSFYSSPVGLTADNDGNLLAGCPANSSIWKFATNGSIARIGYSDTGYADTISGVAFDRDGRLYGTFPYFAEIARFTLSFIPEPGTQSHLGYPVSLAFDASGTVFIANYCRPPLPFPDPFSGNNTNSVEKFSPNLSHLGTLATGLNGPWGLAFDRQGNLFVSVSGDDTILKFATNGSFTVFADYFSSGLWTPKGIAFDSLGNLFVANSGDGTILKLTTNGQATVFATNLVSPTSIAVYPGLKLWRVPIKLSNPAMLPGGGFQFDFITNPYGTNIVLSATNCAESVSDWTVLGTATEISPGLYQFTDAQATNNAQRYYRVRSP